MTGVGGGGLSNFQLGDGGGTGFQLVAVPPTGAGLFPHGALVYGCNTTRHPGGGGMTPLAAFDRTDTQVREMDAPPLTEDGATAKLTQVGGAILQYVSTDIYQVTGDDGTNSVYIPSTDIVITAAEMRQDAAGRLVLAGAAAAQRFKVDLTTDTTVTQTSPATPDAMAIHPSGQYVYATATVAGPTKTLVVYRWDIDGGGGAALQIASFAGLANLGTQGLAVTADGHVVLVYCDETGAGTLLSPYARHFWVRVLDDAGASLHNWDLTSFVPNVNQGVSTTVEGIAINVLSNQIATDQYGGGNHVWCIIAWPNPDTLATDRYMTEVDLDTGAGLLLHRHNGTDPTVAVGASRLLVYAGAAIDGAGLARYPAVDAPATWGPPLV